MHEDEAHFTRIRGLIDLGIKASLPLYDASRIPRAMSMNTELATISAFWVSTLATLIAAGAAWISYAVYRSQADPDIMIYAEVDNLRPSPINLVIRNAGRAAAYDITFTSNLDIPSEAWGLNVTDASKHKRMISGPLVSGIPFLPPDGKRIITWGQYGGLFSAIGDSHILVTSRYKSQHFGIPWKIRHRQTSTLEIASFKGTDASDKNSHKQIVFQLAAIEKAIKNVSVMGKPG